MKKSNRRKSNPALDYDDSDSDYEDFAPPQKKRASSHKKREKISPTWKEEEEIEGFTISTLDSPNGSDSKEIHNKHPRENEEEASEGIAALLGLASEDVVHKKPHKNIFTDPAYSSSESEAKSKESRKHRKALVPVTYTYASSDEDYNSEVYEIEEEEDIEEDLVLENDEAEYQPYSQRTMKKKEKEKVRTPKRSSIKPKRTVKKRTHYPDDSESSEFSSPPPPSSSSISSISTTNTTRTVPINPPPPIPTHLPGTVPVVDNNVASILNNDLSKPMIKTSPMSPSSSKKSSSFPTILPGSHHLSNSRSGWRRGATHVAIAQYIYNQQRQDPKQQHLIHSNGFNGNTHYGNGNHSMNGGTSKMSGIDPTLESKIFKEHAASYSKSPTLHHQQPRNTPSPVSNRQMPMSNYPPPKFPPPPPFSPNTKHFTNSFPGNPFPPPFQNSNGSPFPFPPPQSGYPGPQIQQFPPFPGSSPNYFQPYNSPLPQQHQPQAPSEPKTTIKMIPYSVHHIHHKRPRNKKDPIAASTSNLQLPPPLAPPPLQSRDFTLRPLNLKR